MGVKVQVLSSLQLTAIRFYKDVGETGTHAAGAEPERPGDDQEFAGQSASGWQQQTLRNTC